MWEWDIAIVRIMSRYFVIQKLEYCSYRTWNLSKLWYISWPKEKLKNNIKRKKGKKDLTCDWNRCLILHSKSNYLIRSKTCKISSLIKVDKFLELTSKQKYWSLACYSISFYCWLRKSKDNLGYTVWIQHEMDPSGVSSGVSEGLPHSIFEELRSSTSGFWSSAEALAGIFLSLLA